MISSVTEPQSDSSFNKSSMVCFGAPVWADRIRRGGDAGMAGGSRFVAIGEQGLNSFAVAVSFGLDGTLVGGLLAGLDGAAGGAGGSAKLGTKAGAAALGTKALAEACGAGGVSRVTRRGRASARGFAQRGQRCDARARRRRPVAAGACD